jgi:magnesium-transporting ATPase (P-type)
MIDAAATIISGSTIAKVVVGAFVAGVGVTIAFSGLVYCAGRAQELQRDRRQSAAIAFLALSVVALAACLAIVAYGLVLTTAKPK